MLNSSNSSLSSLLSSLSSSFSSAALILLSFPTAASHSIEERSRTDRRTAAISTLRNAEEFAAAACRLLRRKTSDPPPALPNEASEQAAKLFDGSIRLLAFSSVLTWVVNIAELSNCEIPPEALATLSTVITQAAGPALSLPVEMPNPRASAAIAMAPVSPNQPGREQHFSVMVHIFRAASISSSSLEGSLMK